MKLAILDKDGTLVKPKSGEAFVQHPEDQELLPGVKDAIARLIADGYTLAIASNQGGVAAGYKTLESAIAEMRYCLNLLPVIKTAYFCPDGGYWCHLVRANGFHYSISSGHEEYQGWNFRKPGAGMLDLAIRGFSATKVVMIGDRTEDGQAALNAGIPFLHADKWREGAIGV